MDPDADADAERQRLHGKPFLMFVDNYEYARISVNIAWRSGGLPAEQERVREARAEAALDFEAAKQDFYTSPEWRNCARLTKDLADTTAALTVAEAAAAKAKAELTAALATGGDNLKDWHRRCALIEAAHTQATANAARLSTRATILVDLVEKAKAIVEKLWRERANATCKVVHDEAEREQQELVAEIGVLLTKHQHRLLMTLHKVQQFTHLPQLSRTLKIELPGAA